MITNVVSPKGIRRSARFLRRSPRIQQQVFSLSVNRRTRDLTFRTRAVIDNHSHRKCCGIMFDNGYHLHFHRLMFHIVTTSVNYQCMYCSWVTAEKETFVHHRYLHNACGDPAMFSYLPNEENM